MIWDTVNGVVLLLAGCWGAYLLGMTATGPSSVSHHTLSHQIRETIVRRIVAGELEPGERLVEAKLAAAFGTSQAPVREAFRELETFGLVEIRPRRGTFVRSFIQQTLRESYVVRAALEETATRLVLLADAVPAERLTTAVDRMCRAAENGDVEETGAASVAFHRHIVEAAGNDLLARTWEALHIEARTSVTLMAITPDLAAIVEDHRALLASLLVGDLEAACREAREHQWHYANVSNDVNG